VGTAEQYRRFASGDARGKSACYAEWADGVAGDQPLIELIDGLPEAKRQPNLFFAAARLAGIDAGPFVQFRTELIRRWPQVCTIVLSKQTQTNEAGRCAVLLPVLAALPQPLALLEVGASAGLCLYPDRYSYQYGNRPCLDPIDGPGPLLRCAIAGPVPIPATLPEVVWRAGIDLNPLDVTDPDDVHWLETLIWPGQPQRRERLAAAVEVARADPPLLMAGDLTDTVEQMIGQAPAGATLVIFHSSALAYLDPDARATFVATMHRVEVQWVANEIPGVIAPADPSLPPPPDPTRTLSVLAHNGQPLAYADPHGQALNWFG
jgi:hypothetical protein